MSTQHKEIFSVRAVSSNTEMQVQTEVTDGKLKVSLGDFQVQHSDVLNLCGSMLRALLIHDSNMPTFMAIPPDKGLHPMVAVDEMQYRMESLKAELVRRVLTQVVDDNLIPEAVIAIHYEVHAKQPSLINTNGSPMAAKITHVIPSFVAFPANKE